MKHSKIFTVGFLIVVAVAVAIAQNGQMNNRQMMNNGMMGNCNNMQHNGMMMNNSGYCYGLVGVTDSAIIAQHTAMCPMNHNIPDSLVQNGINNSAMMHNGMMMNRMNNGMFMCPVTGNPIDTAYHTMYNNQQVYFANKRSMNKFMKNPEKYLNK